MLAIRQSSGSSPNDSDWLKINVRTGAITALVSLSIRGDILSGPVDLVTSKLFSSFKTPGSVISKSGINEEAILTDGRVFKFSCVNTDEK